MKPILFNTEMVKAILDNRKSVTRRAIKLKSGYHLVGKASEITENIKLFGSDSLFYNGEETNETLKPPYQVGDILYVRETWQCLNPYSVKEYVYKASCDKDYAGDIGNWLPSIHMPKKIARIFLKVADVRVERLQDITIDGIDHEGICLTYPIIRLIDSEYFKKFIELWNSTIKKQDLDIYGWDANPWVWVIEFERIEVE